MASHRSAKKKVFLENERAAERTSKMWTVKQTVTPVP